jgi:hypothetical protein
MQSAHLSILQCPISQQELLIASREQLAIANEQLHEFFFSFEEGLVNAGADWFFPAYKDVYCLHPFYAIPLKENARPTREMEFDKKRIFNYFNQIGYQQFEGQSIYDDAKQFVDFRPFLLPYTQHGFYNCRQYLDQQGKYYVDVACGSVAFKEYIQLAEGFEYRVCVDQSLNALLQAKQNLHQYGQNGIFICGDLVSLPLKTGIADAVLCQHALFHVPASYQLKALQELVRVAATGKKIAIVYDWFYHSWFMNLALGPYQLYRIFRHYAGKIYARLLNKDKLYFYSHGLSWFRRNNPGKKLSVYVWRSFNIHFSRIYLHKKLGGEKLLSYIWKLEKKYPEKMGKLGEYPIIVIEK